jgi:peptidoglycan/LPS O-acetylase OafA/YrhL
VAVVGPRTRRLLARRPVAWAGSRSYSLYLVHEPIVVLAAFALGGAPTLPLLVVVAVPPVVLLTEGFFRLVERPSHALSRRVRGYALRSSPRSSGDRAQVS